MKDTQGKMENRDDMFVTDNNHVEDADDKYTDSIDLSNACRQFYQSRKQAAEVVKERLAKSGRQRPSKKKTSIDVAMETLRTEMASLMDQDLSLMKQLLTLNESIEDLKWQKKYYHSQNSMPASSCDLSDSDWSVSETDMYGSENEVSRKYPTPSSLSLHSRLNKKDESDETHTGVDIRMDYSRKTVLSRHQIVNNNSSKVVKTTLPADLEYFLAGNSNICHEEQNSFDSGIHEPILRKEITV